MNRHACINTPNIPVSTCEFGIGFNDDDGVSKLAELRRSEEGYFLPVNRLFLDVHLAKTSSVGKKK